MPRATPTEAPEPPEPVPDPDEPWLTADEAAAWLRVTTDQLSGMRYAGTGPTYAKFGKRVRYHKSDLVEWSRDQRRTGTSQYAPRPA